MDPDLTLAPLFEVLVELQGDDIVFVPSLDSSTENQHNFYNMVQNLLDDVIHMGIIIPRISNLKRSYTFMVSSG